MAENKSKHKDKEFVTVKFTVPPLEELEARLTKLSPKFADARKAMREEIARIKNWS